MDGINGLIVPPDPDGDVGEPPARLACAKMRIEGVARGKGFPVEEHRDEKLGPVAGHGFTPCRIDSAIAFRARKRRPRTVETGRWSRSAMS